MARAKSTKNGQAFTTIKVRDELRRWIKIQAASKGVPMYVVIEQMLAKSLRGRPWEKAKA